MAINFPDSPSNGDTVTVNNKVWTWNGTTWDVVISSPLATLLVDADADTKIQVEESTDEDIIRFDTAGSERVTIAADGTVTIFESLTVGGGASVVAGASASAFHGDLTGGTITGTLNAPYENWNISATAATGTVNIDILTSSAWYYTTAATGNWTLNFRGDGSTTLDSLLAVGETVTASFLATIGGSAYYPTAFQVDGSAVTPEWQNAAAPTAGNANQIDVYTFTIVKTASATFTVLGSNTTFG